MNKTFQFASSKQRRGAFTLIELLISLSILLILATMTMRMVASMLDSDRIRTSARELQSYLAGARDRAIYAGEPRGVRFILDQSTDASAPSTVRSFVYIGAPTSFTDGTSIDVKATGIFQSGTATPPGSWQSLVDRGLLKNGAQIQLATGGTDAGVFLTIGIPTASPATFFVTSANVTLPINNATYKLQLAPAILSNEVPRVLATGIVVDLDNSKLPSAWGTSGSYSSTLDILFSPGGNVTGNSISAGKIHFVLSEFNDASTPATTAPTGVPLLDKNAQWIPNATYSIGNWIVPTTSNDRVFLCVAAGTSGTSQPAQFDSAVVGQSVNDGSVTGMWQCFIPKTRLIVSLAAQAGRVTTHPIDPNDKYRYAEIGEVTQ
jgi:prepilin-type N-terminal cleavage/methylation domain-containing protein